MPGALANYATNGLWKYARHLKYIEDKLLAVAEGKIDRLLISVPPQHGKSMLTSQYFTAWFLGRFPDKKVILTSYEATFAASWGRKSRDILEEHGEKVFGVKISSSSAAADHWEIHDHLGGMVTAGAGGSITGKGGDLLIIDDPIKNNQEALSATRLNAIWEWYQATVYTRLSPTGAIVVIMTRWSPEDLVGRLLQDQKDGGDEWVNVCLPAIAEEGDQLGRKEGEPIWPQRYSLKWVEQRKRVLQAFWFEALYQQRPAPRAGYVINIDWFRRYRVPPERKKAEMVVLSFDTAQKESELSGYTVCTVWYFYDSSYYLIDVVRDRYRHPRLISVAKNLVERWRPHAVLIEDKATGSSLIEHLRDETSAPVLPIEPQDIGSKAVRMQNETPAVEAGQVHIPEDGTAVWLYDFIEELRSFPNSTHKDQVDSFSQFLRWARERGSGIEMW